MAEQKGKIDFASGQRSGDEPLGGAIPQSVNVLVDGVGAIHLRPGIAAWEDFGQSPLYDETTSVDGIVVWNGYVVYVTSDRLIHAQVGPGNGTDISDATAATQLDGASRPVMIAAEGVGGTNDMAIMAGGGQLQVWEGPGAGLSRRIAGTVPDATHCVVLSLHLVVNPTSAPGQIQWSEANTFETWIGEFAEISSSPDRVIALYTNTGELIIGGTDSVEAWAPDPQENYKVVRPWSSGFGAAYSFASNDETFGFLDNRMRIQLSNGRAYKAISDRGITSTLQEFATTDDCWGFRAQIAGWNLLGWHFPTVGRTFVWDVDRETWSEWRGFAAGQYKGWIAKSLAFWADEKLHLVGLGDGTIGKLDPNTLSDNGEPIVAEIYSGFVDHGVDNWKQHISTRLAFRRGLGAFGRAPGPNCQLFWRDDTGAWEDPVELELGNVDDPNPVIEVRSLGVYRTRQWRLRFSDNVPVAFVGAVETFEVLEQ